MRKHELSAPSFALIDRAFSLALEHPHSRKNPRTEMEMRELKELFSRAHTGWLELEDDNAHT